jgi:hypothetical protein
MPPGDKKEDKAPGDNKEDEEEDNLALEEIELEQQQLALQRQELELKQRKLAVLRKRKGGGTAACRGSVVRTVIARRVRRRLLRSKARVRNLSACPPGPAHSVHPS